MKRASELQNLKLPGELNFEPDFSQLPDPSWFGIEVEFSLLSPWYSKDDRPFHVLDNPVRKDRVFGVPFMSAASWKGLLRWACRMEAGLYGHLESHDMKMDGWKDPAWIVHLFGNERAEGEEFSRGALVFYPTWFSKVGFEVINPHKRKTRAGTQPIYYEVVPAGTEGKLQLLYAPLPGEIENDKVKPAAFIDNLLDSIAALLETYGISAKRTAGWGTAKILDRGWKISPETGENGKNGKNADEIKAEIKSRIAQKGGGQ
jgi:CRISPR-associated protein Cmr2